MNGIEKSRQLRAYMKDSCSFFLSDESALVEAGDKLEWHDIEELPYWCHWDCNRLYNLSITAGTVFLLPSIRLWIKSCQIKEVQSLIGKNLYDFLMEYTYMEVELKKHTCINDVENTLSTTGSTVILSSAKEKYRPWLLRKLKKPNGILDEHLAREILNHTLYAINKTTKMHENDKLEV